MLLGGHDPEAVAAKQCLSSWIYMDFPKIGDVRAFPAPPQPKTMRETKYLDPKASHEKNVFFCRKCFFAIFFTFFDTSTSRFSRFCRSGDVSVPTIVRVIMCQKMYGGVRGAKNTFD